MKKSSLLLLVCLAVFFGCKKEKSDIADPDHVKQTLYYTYDADNLDSYFYARFFDVDHTRRMELVSPSTVTLNGVRMVYDTSFYYYYTNLENEKLASGIFVYTDIWHRDYSNTINLQKSVELPSALDTIYRDRDNVISWVGDPYSGGSEKLMVKMGIILSLPTVLVYATQAGATSVTITPAMLTNGSGLTKIALERNNQYPLQKGTQAGGVMYATYKSKIRWVYVK